MFPIENCLDACETVDTWILHADNFQYWIETFHSWINLIDTNHHNFLLLIVMLTLTDSMYLCVVWMYFCCHEEAVSFPLQLWSFSIWYKADEILVSVTLWIVIWESKLTSCSCYQELWWWAVVQICLHGHFSNKSVIQQLFKTRTSAITSLLYICQSKSSISVAHLPNLVQNIHISSLL